MFRDTVYPLALEVTLLARRSDTPSSDLFSPPRPDDDGMYALEKRRTYETLSELDQPTFEKRIRKVRTTLLADLRYDFGWDPDPRRSLWQARYINRELTLRQIRRTTRPQWYGIALSSLLALASLIVAIIALLRPPAGAG